MALEIEKSANQGHNGIMHVKHFRKQIKSVFKQNFFASNATL